MNFEQAQTQAAHPYSVLGVINSSRFEEHKQDQPATSIGDLKQANAFFDTIKDKERANSKLPNLTFDIVEKGDGPHKTYILNEHQKPSKFSSVTRPEIGKFHIDDNGNLSTKAQEFIPGADGALTMRETDQFTDFRAGRVTTKIFEGKAPEKDSPMTKLQQVSEVTKNMNGEEVSSAKFSYAGGRVSETIVNRNSDGSTRTQIFEGADVDHLKPMTQVIKSKDGSELSTSFSYADGKVSQSVVSRNPDGSSSTQVFEGADKNGLRLVSHVSKAPDGSEVFSSKISYSGDKVSQTLTAHDKDGGTTKQVLEGNKDNLRLKSELVAHKDGSSISTSFEYSGSHVTKTVLASDKDGTSKKQVFSGEGENLKPTSEVVTKNGEPVYSASFDYSSGKPVQTVVGRDAAGNSKTQIIEGEGADRKLKSEILTSKDGVEIQKIVMEDIRNQTDGSLGRRETVTKHSDNDNSVAVTIFEGSSDQDLKPKMVRVADANGRETKRAVFEDILDSEKHVIGVRQTVVSHTQKNTLTTSILEGKPSEQLKERERIISGADGKIIKHYVANSKGELEEKR